MTASRSEGDLMEVVIGIVVMNWLLGTLVDSIRETEGRIR